MRRFHSAAFSQTTLACDMNIILRRLSLQILKPLPLLREALVSDRAYFLYVNLCLVISLDTRLTPCLILSINARIFGLWVVEFW